MLHHKVHGDDSAVRCHKEMRIVEHHRGEVVVVVVVARVEAEVLHIHHALEQA